MKNKILITKDIVRTDYLGVNGKKLWDTPNINELADKGTIFKQHYTAGASTAMAVTSMFTGKYSFEMDRKKYVEVKQFEDNETLFDVFNKKGLKTFVIWPFEFKETAWKYSKIFPKETNVIYLKDIAQNIVRDVKRDLIIDDTKSLAVLKSILKEIDGIIFDKKTVFIWVHLPHVIEGRTGYGSDIDLFDELIGKIRKRFDDNSIYISTDHGHMNCEKGVPVYGFHVYNGIIRIPLITPRIENLKEVNFPTSNTQLKDIILHDKIIKQNYVYSETQYYLQENRKLAIIKNNYKYIYNKRDNTEELYDLDFDYSENVNLLIDKCYDRNRLGYYKLNEIYYYPYWNKIEKIYFELKTEKDRIWKQGSWIIETIYKINNFRKNGIKNITDIINSKKISGGRFDSMVKNNYYNI